MKPKQIFPESAEKIPSVRDELRKIAESYPIDEKISEEGLFYSDEYDFLIRVHSYSMDFNQGQEIAKIEIQKPEYQIYITVESVFVSDIVIKFTGFHKDEEVEIFP